LSARFAAVSAAKKTLKLALLAPAMSGRVREPGLFVLIYHRIGAGMGEEMDLPAARFAKQMNELRDHHDVVALREGLDALAGGRAPSGDLVAVTFDDGYSEVFSAAWPVLKDLAIPATVFVATGFLEGESEAPIRESASTEGARAQPLTWDQLAEMTETGLVSAGSHSHTHRNFDTLSAADAEDEVTRSKRILEHRTGATVDVFAYPRAIAGHEAIVAKTYQFAVLGDGTKNVASSFDPQRISRTPVRASDGMFFFRKRLEGMRPLEDGVYARLRGSPA
jgi:peptidoglycan/xylan/chitin deacetylase (PgdA/CDA1 family)